MAVIDQVITKDYALYNGDDCEVLPMLPENSVHMCIDSPPFMTNKGGLYNYSSSERDLSNSRSYAEFFEHFDFILRETHRVLVPGGIAAVHCMDTPIDGANAGGGLIDFSGDLRAAHTRCRKPDCAADEYTRNHGLCGHGLFQYAARYHIWKEPLGVRNRTMAKGLAHQQLVEDSSLCDVAAADYLLMFRKKGKRPVPVAHPEGLSAYAGSRQIPHELLSYRGWKGKQIENRLSHWIWRQYASAFWDDIRIERTLPYKEARDPEDERHVHPSQLDWVERAIILWSNPGETILTRFMGVGSEVYGAMLNGRKAIGVELKRAYFIQAVRNVAEALKQEPGTVTQMNIFDEIENVHPSEKLPLPASEPEPLPVEAPPAKKANPKPATQAVQTSLLDDPQVVLVESPMPVGGGAPSPMPNTAPTPSNASHSPILSDAVGGYDTGKARGMLAFAAKVKAVGRRAEIETEGNLDILKAARLCNAILRGVASSRPAVTPERWEKATGFVVEFFEIENTRESWIPAEHREDTDNG